MTDSATPNDNTKHNELHEATHGLLKYFVERQHIVLNALRDLRPDLIIRAEGRIEEMFTRAEWQQYVRKYMRASQLGYWGEQNEWSYFVHGVGCRMKHTMTDEPLDWDLGNLRVFHTQAFIHHTQWSLEKRQNEYTTIISNKIKTDDEKSLSKLITDTLIELSDIGIVKSNKWRNKYILIVT